MPDADLRAMSKAELMALVGRLRAFGRVEAAVRAALDGVPEGGVGAARAALALNLARLIDDPPEKAKASEIASASKELRALLAELARDQEGDEPDIFDDVPTPMGDAPQP